MLSDVIQRSNHKIGQISAPNLINQGYKISRLCNLYLLNRFYFQKILIPRWIRNEITITLKQKNTLPKAVSPLGSPVAFFPPLLLPPLPFTSSLKVKKINSRPTDDLQSVGWMVKISFAIRDRGNNRDYGIRIRFMYVHRPSSEKGRFARGKSILLGPACGG